MPRMTGSRTVALPARAVSTPVSAALRERHARRHKLPPFWRHLERYGVRLHRAARQAERERLLAGAWLVAGD